MPVSTCGKPLRTWQRGSDQHSCPFTSQNRNPTSTAKIRYSCSAQSTPDASAKTAVSSATATPAAAANWRQDFIVQLLQLREAALLQRRLSGMAGGTARCPHEQPSEPSHTIGATPQGSAAQSSARRIVKNMLHLHHIPMESCAPARWPHRASQDCWPGTGT